MQGSWRRLGWVAAAVLVGAFVVGSGKSARADDGPPATDLEEAIRLAPITVIGSESAETTLPGSGTYIDTRKIRDQTYDDPNRVFRRVPGVYVRPEDGYGLFPNLSLRGADTARSAKVTLMEDGVLAAPAPYSAPSAYYSPTTGRMSAIEVLKGSSQIRFGPHITGGVVNYVSTPVPDAVSAYMKAVYGSENEMRLHGHVGGTFETGIGRVGFLFEGYHRDTDGFKTIDAAPGIEDRRETGFQKTDPMAKLVWEPDTDTYMRFEFKWGRSRLDANETYLGLTEDDFDADPYRRYAASRFDNIDATHERTYLRYHVAPTDDFDLTATWYYSRFERDWFKLHDVKDASGVRANLANAIAAGGSHLRTLRGEAAGELRVRHNARAYALKGVDTVAKYRFDLGDTSHEIAAGVRVHEDKVRRFQRNELFTQAADGSITARDPGTPGDAGNRRQKTDAVAWFAQDEVSWDRLTVTPGVRVEHLRQDHDDFDDPTTRGRNTMSMTAVGVGGTWEHDDDWTLFGGVHEGFSPPSPRAAIKDGLTEEESLGFELGARFEDEDSALRGSLTLFRTDFDDLIVIENIGGAGTGDSENVGEVRTQGVELALEFDPAAAAGESFRNPWFVTATYTDAELTSDSSSSDAESVFAGGEKGNDVPYVPEFSVTVGTGIEIGDLGVYLTGTYADSTYTTASNTSSQVTPDGTPDARFGKTDAYVVVDLAARYQVDDHLALVGGIQNLFDEEYLVSRHPHGPRPGKPLFAYLGFELDF